MGGKFQGLFNLVKQKVDEKGGVKGIMKAWDSAGKEEPEQQMYKRVEEEKENKDEKPKKDNKMLIYLGLAAVVLFMLMKKK